MGMFDDALSWLDNKRRVAGRNVSDLWIDTSNALNKTGHQAALEIADINNYGPGALKGMLGVTAWHGSPHKFDKFSLDKIGTGEGAQAYGHGLYLAEAPAVAQEYAGALSAAKATKPVGNVDLTQAYQNLPNDVPETLLAARRDFRALTDAGELSTADLRDFLTAVKNNLAASKNGQLYKTDIPDEAVARFLDWDKPLSHQAPEVQPALRQMLEKAKKSFPQIDPSGDPVAAQIHHLYAQHRGGNSDAPVKIAEELRQQGIPGIRYLDGGSRSAGQGSSNFVVFDPEMIRILERNGQPTGQKPWKPRELDILRDTTAESPLFPDTTR